MAVIALVSLVLQACLPGFAYGKTLEATEAAIPESETAVFADNLTPALRSNSTTEPSTTQSEEPETSPEPPATASAPLPSPANHPTINLDKQVDLSLAHPGDLLTYTLHWSIGGNGTATNVVVTDPVPTELSFVQAENGGIYDSGTATITWTLGTQASGAHGMLTWTGTINTLVGNGTVITNTATIDADRLDPVSDSATTTIESIPSIGLEKTVSAEIAAPGTTLTYTLAWNVSGSGPAYDLVLTDPIPANLIFATISQGGVYDPNLNELRWNLGNQAPGAHGSVQWTAEIISPLANGTVITNTATLSASELKPVQASASTTVTSLAMLHLTKEVAPTLALPNELVTYTLAWSVSGTEAVNGLLLRDPLPEGLTFVSASNGGAYNAPTREINWTLGSAQPGDSGSVTVQTRVAAGTQPGAKLNNTATLSADNAQPVSASASLTVGGAPKLTIVKSADKDSVKPGETILYTIVVSNTGSGDALQVVVSDVLPTGFVYLDNGATDRSFPIGTLKAETSRTLTYAVVVKTDTKAGSYQNVATVSSSNHPTRNAKATVEVSSLVIPTNTPSPKLTLTKVADRSTVPIGGVVTYTLSVRNDGLAPAYNLRLTDEVPAGLSFVDYSGSTATWRLGDLLPGHERIIHVAVRVSASAAAGQLINTARVVGDNVAQLTATAAITVQRGQVLGALTETGASPIEYGILAFGLTSLLLGVTLFRRRIPELD